MNAEKQARLQAAIETAQTNLADLKTQRDAAQAELANLRAGRGGLVERRNTAAKLSVEATEKKTALARQQVKGTRTAAEIARDSMMKWTRSKPSLPKAPPRSPPLRLPCGLPSSEWKPPPLSMS